MNEEILKEVTNQDYPAITKKIEDFLKNQVSISKTNGVILGTSGGIDSAVKYPIRNSLLSLEPTTSKFLELA